MNKSNLDEYIKRGDAMEAVEDDYNLCFAMDPTIPQDFAYYKVKRAAVRAIARVHPADVKPVIRAEWIPGREIAREYVGSRCTDIRYEDWHCGHCGCICEQPYKPAYRYCPLCGADMRKEKEDGRI